MIEVLAIVLGVVALILFNVKIYQLRMRIKELESRPWVTTAPGAGLIVNSELGLTDEELAEFRRAIKWEKSE